jgi:early endosome antigen 1
LESAEAKVKATEEGAKKSAQDLKNLQSDHAKLQEIYQGKVKEVDDMINELRRSEQSVSSLKEELSNATSSLEECQINAKSQTAILESKLEAVTMDYSGVLKILEDSEKAHADMKASLEVQLQQKEEHLSKKLIELEELKQTIGEMKADLSKSDAKIQQLQVQTDEILTEKIELENKIKMSEDGKSRLLERCLAGETESERLQETINELRRKLDDSISALQELGRENQSWQMENAKAQGRKWADDAIVTSCLSCNKEFTLTVRKHHCRHCGQIFCNECSSRSASMPSCKKPARVCDSCFDELTMK